MNNPPAELIETFGWWPGEGFRHWPRHRQRLLESAVRLGWHIDPTALDEHWLQAQLERQWTGPCAQPARRCRLTLAASGQLQLQVSPMPAQADRWRLALSPWRLRSDDPWLQLKSSHRQCHDAARASMPAGIDEVLLLNEREELCEGSISNVFVYRHGQWLTPPLSCGLLPGILRQILLEGGAREQRLFEPDLYRAERIAVGNSLRGLIAAEL